MCDPMSIIGLGLSVGMAAANYSAQQQMIDNQNAANADWIDYQRRQSQQYAAQDEQLRQNAEAAREATLAQLTPQKQQQAQQNEQARLTTEFSPEKMAAMAAGDKQTINDQMLSGQQNTAGSVKANIQSQIAQAAQEAQQRIAALAAVQSYGGSQFGLTNRANAIFNAGNQDIRLASDERTGLLSAYNVAKSVEPIKYVMQPNPFGGAAQAGAQAAGKGLGTMMGSAMMGGASV